MDDLSNPIWAQGRTSEAESLLKEALEIDKWVLGYENAVTLDTMLTLGEYYVTDGRCALAEPLQRKVLEVQTRLQGPNDPNALQAAADLATAILIGPNRSKSRVNEALELARRDTNADPYRIGFLEILGLALYRVGNWNEAINAVSNAMESDKGQWPDLYFLLAMAQLRQGDRAHALQNYSKGVHGIKDSPTPDFPQKVLWGEAAFLLGKTPPPCPICPVDLPKSTSPQSTPDSSKAFGLHQ